MPLSIEIPDEVMTALKLPPRSAERDLRVELAIHLVAEGLLPQASACRLAGLPRLAFEQLLNERRIATTSQSADDLSRDLEVLSDE